MSKSVKAKLLGAVSGIAALAAFAAAHASVATLSGYATADNAFQAYLSTDDSVQGDLIGQGYDWGGSFAVNSGPLTASTYYLHIVANDYGRPDGFLGFFTLTGPYTFANATTSLGTNTTDWRATGGSASQPWTTPVGTPNFIADNGGGPWGYHSAMGATAHWIWSSPDTDRAFFSTTITGPSTAPEPVSWALMISGFGLAGAALRRRRTATVAA